jgi:thioredoxin reductase (NADPH)
VAVDLDRLEVPGADRLTGLGVFYGSATTEAPACADEDVYVVGGANAAGQAAVFLSRRARRVTVLVRGDGLERSMSQYLIRQIREVGNVQVRTDGERLHPAVFITGDDPKRSYR